VDWAHAPGTIPTATAPAADAEEPAPATASSAPPAREAERPPRAGGSAVTPAETTPAALFGRASRARTQSDYKRALRLYRDLQRRFPDSTESRASGAIIARLLLDTGQPEAALADYDRYLADGRAPLTEEAMVGRALAYQRLGRIDEERGAWLGLLRHFPDSMHAMQARARLQALSGRGRE